MRKITTKALILSILILWCTVSFALDSEEMFENGKRAFNLSRWQECEEMFDRIIELWPEHKKMPEFLYYRSISIIRNLDKSVNDYKAGLVEKALHDIKTISLELPENDITELKAAEAMGSLDSEPTNWGDFSQIKPELLKHYILRNHHPNPNKVPVQTIEWLNSYKQINEVMAPDLESLLELLKVKALWRLLLSPLVASEYEDKLKLNNVWPLSKAFENSLKKGFKIADPSIKRKFALYGFHYDFLKSGLLDSEKKNGNKLNESSWLKYLKERGLASSETLCPY